MWQKLKVVELASVLAGPLVGTFFAELGAEVIKIENLNTGGDVTRKWKLGKENPNNSISAYYASANFGKQSVMLDLHTEEGYAKAIEVILEADIVIQNFKVGDAKKLKLDAKHLLSIKPELIVASISGFGPNNKRPAFDVVLQAETGFMYMNGSATSGPIKMPVALIDILAAHHLKEAILIALLEREESGLGREVHVSLYDAAIASLANQASNFLMEGHIPQPIGTAHPNIAPYGDMYKTKDYKQMVLAIGSEKHFQLLCAVLPPLKANYERFKSNALRLKNRESLNTIIAASIVEYESKIIEKLFLEKGIPFGLVKNLEEVFSQESAKKLIRNDKIEGCNTQGVKTLLI